jgi:Cu(I)/Ag(I) efflux system membrane fusion protein
LAADDLARYQALRGPVRDALLDLTEADPKLTESLAVNPADPLPARENLKEAREDFVRFSTTVTDMVRTNKIDVAAKLHVFECTMAPGVGTGRWVQREAGAMNPFHGAKMLQCGVELDRETSTHPMAVEDLWAVEFTRGARKNLPADHPPLDGLWDVKFTRAVRDKAAIAAPSDGCGGCGMSKAAMTAGAPCERGVK